MAVSATEEDTKSSGTLAGILWMLVSGFLFLAVTVVVRYLGTELPAVQAAFLRYVFGLFIILPIFFRARRRLPSGRLLGVYTIRGLVHGVSVMLWFYAMARIPIAEVTAIGYMTPIFITIGAGLFLGEIMHLRRIGAVVAAFVGVLIILRPGFEEVSIGSLAQFLAAPFFAASYLIAKRLTAEEETVMIVAMLSLMCTLVLLPGALYVWEPPTFAELGFLFLTAILATAGHYTLTRALQAAPIMVTQPISYLQLVWAVIIGIVVFADPLDFWVILGGAVIVGATTYISHREVVAAGKAQPKPGPH